MAPKHTNEVSTMTRPSSISIRLARPADAPAVQRLEILDETDLAPGTVLVAEVDGEMVAAIEADGPGVAANPFRRTAEVVDLMRMRAAHLTGRPERRRRFTRARRPQFAAAYSA